MEYTEITIRHEDGYQISVAPYGVTVTQGTGSVRLDPVLLRAITDADGDLVKKLRARNVDPANYYTDGTAVLRRGHGLEAALEVVAAKRAAIEAQRAEYLAQAAEHQAAQDRDYATLVAQIPEGSSQVTARLLPGGDGYDLYAYSVGDLELGWGDVTIVGYIGSRQVASITDEQLAQLRADAAQVAARKEVAVSAEAGRVARLKIEATATGKPQVLKTWVTDYCTRHQEDCSFDQATRWAMPDGTEKTTYDCCY